MDTNRKPSIKKAFNDTSIDISFEGAMPYVKECVENHKKQLSADAEKINNKKGNDSQRLANF